MTVLSLPLMMQDVEIELLYGSKECRGIAGHLLPGDFVNFMKTCKKVYYGSNRKSMDWVLDHIVRHHLGWLKHNRIFLNVMQKDVHWKKIRGKKVI